MMETKRTPDETVASADFKLISGLFFRLLPYQILLIVINAVNNIIDGLFGSNMIGQDAMSAIGLFVPMTHFLYAISFMLVSGSQLMYGKYLVKKPERTHSIFTVDLLTAAGISVLTSVIIALAVATGATAIMVKDAAECAAFNRYLLGQAVGIPALVLGQQLFAFLSLENQSRRTTAAGILCFSTNIVMNYLFVVIIPWGTFGLGLSTSISEWAFFGVQAVYYLSRKSNLKFSLKSCRRHDALLIIRRGYAGALSRFVEMFRCILVNALIIKYVGSGGLSSFAASNAFLSIIWALPFGMIAVERMLFSISIGEEDRRSVVDTMRVVVRKGVPLMCCVSVLLILFAVPLTRMFYRDPSDPVYHMTVMGFRMLPLCMPLSVISLSFASFSQSAQKHLMSIILPVVDGFAGVSLTSLFLIPLMKMNGLYLANILNGFICLVVIVAFSYWEKKRFPRNMDDLLALPDTFGAASENRLDITVRNMTEVEAVSEAVIKFCRQHGMDRRETFFSGLALEEMAGNVVSHGFRKDRKKNHSADIRVICRDDGILLRIRDDCVPFNPSDRLGVLEPEDKMRNAGIRLVYAIADDIQYQNLLGLNVLTVRISSADV